MSKVKLSSDATRRDAARFLRLFLLVMVAGLAGGSAFAAEPAGNAARPYWVFFTDKGADLDDAAALESATAIVSGRALRRRAGVLPANRLVTHLDIPVAEAYVDWLLSRGFEIRARSRWLNAVSVTATPTEATLLPAEAPFIARVAPVAASERRREIRVEPTRSGRLPAPGSPYDARGRYTGAARGAADDPLDYGGSLAELTQINVPAVHQMGITGSGVIVGMLDSGFNTTHEALVAVDVLGAWDFINDDPVVANEEGDHEAQENHGTKTLSSIGGFLEGELIGSGFGASFYLAKTEDTSQEVPIEEDYWVEGIEWLESVGCDIVSSSLCYWNWYEFEDLDGNTCVTTIAADAAVALGVAVFNSAGNSRLTNGHILAPSDGDSVICVGGVDADGVIASFSSPGPTADGRIKPDISARGVECHTVTPGTLDEYSLSGGTSFACPLSAGVGALLLSARPGTTPMELRDALRSTADRADNPDNDYGWGIIDALAALAHLEVTAVAEPAPAAALTGSFPNPFNPRTTIAFSLATPAAIRLTIHDLRGRLVATLVEGELEAGEHACVWDGRDDAGRLAAGGLYLARLETGDRVQRHKMLLLK